MSRGVGARDAAHGLDRGVVDRWLAVVRRRDLLEPAWRRRRLTVRLRRRRAGRRWRGSRLGGLPRRAAVLVGREAVEGLVGQSDQRLADRPCVLDELAPLGPDLVDVLVELARALLGVAAHALRFALGLLDPRVRPGARPRGDL